MTTAPSTPASGNAARTAAYFATFICHGLVIAALGPTLPALAQQTQSSLGQIGILFVARSLGYLIGSLLCGRLYDRLPGHRITVCVLVINAAMMTLTPVVPLLWILSAVMVVLGISEGTLDIGTNTLLVWIHGRKVPPFMNALHFFFGLGAFLSPIIVAQVVLLTGGIKWAYWILAMVLIPPAAWVACLPSPRPREASHDEEDAPRDSLLIVLIAVFFFLYVGSEIGFSGWVFTYATKLGLCTETTAAYLTSAFWGAFTIGRLVAVPVAMGVKPRHILFVDIIGCVIALSAILAWPSSAAVLWGGSIMLGFFMASVFPTTLSVAERRMSITGEVTGWFFVGASLGAMLLPGLVGRLLESLGPRAVIATPLSAMLLAGVVATQLIRAAARSRAGS